jgi:hypothetical protein
VVRQGRGGAAPTVGGRRGRRGGDAEETRMRGGGRRWEAGGSGEVGGERETRGGRRSQSRFWVSL